MEVWPGSAYPLGATFDGTGTNFALFSERAERVELCLLADDLHRDPDRTDRSGRLRVALLPAAGPARTEVRLPGPRPVRPGHGNRFNPNKLLLDPYAKAIQGQIDWDPALFSYNFGDPDSRNDSDSAPHTMHGVVINPFFDWDGDRQLRIPYHQSVIYEAHVKGLTELHPEIPEEQRGTYAGVAHPAVIEHLKKLGVTAIELMPVHQFVNDGTLEEKGLNNYWGYNTIGFFAPQNTYSSTGDIGQQVQEFKAMVRELHQAGIEVILDVVYNHTAEGNHLGPTLSFKGIDNAGLLPAGGRRPEALHGLHRHRQLAERPAPALAAAADGLPALLGDGDARRRLPLRPRLHAGPRVLRRRQAVHLLRTHPAGPGRLPGQADRRAVGRRPRRLPGGQLPAAVDRMERQVPRHRPRLLARRAGHAGRVRLRA